MFTLQLPKPVVHGLELDVCLNYESPRKGPGFVYATLRLLFSNLLVFNVGILLKKILLCVTV